MTTPRKKSAPPTWASNQPGFDQIGVVEGFYGRVWHEEERRAFVEALAPFGLNTYLYCPKHEPTLAAQSMEPLFEEDKSRLGRLTAHCRGLGIQTWAGLHLEPPFDATNEAHLTALANKTAQLHQVGFAGLTFLFDDLSATKTPEGRFAGSLAAAQAHTVTEVMRLARLVGVTGDWQVCPSLYTLDEILEREYGPHEPDYLRKLDEALPADVSWLWTGPRVVSPQINLSDLAAWRGGSTRPVVLWDNYPVNDAAMVHSLHLTPLLGRAANLAPQVKGYLFNPLLQPAIGAIPGATCLAWANDPTGYNPARAWEKALEANLPAEQHGLLGELEALTRHTRIKTFVTEPRLPRAGFLAERLATTWKAHQAGKPLEKPVVREFGALLSALESDLPGTMIKEIHPWLSRLRAAHGVFYALSHGENHAVATDAYRRGEAHVLGDWFQP